MRSSNITIEIVLPFYNCSQYIEPQLHSIFENCVPSNFSILVIIIDDSSDPNESEKLVEICRNYSSVKIIKNESNLGVVKSIERGLLATSAEFVMLCDHDDYWLPNKIQLSVKKILEMNNEIPVLVFTNLNVVNEDLGLIHPSMFNLFQYSPEKLRHNLIIQNMVTGCTTILNRKLVELSLPFPNDLLIHDHWLALCATYGGDINYLKQPTILYRQHDRNLIGARKQGLLIKVWNLKSVILRKQRSHIHKGIQIRQLAERLFERGLLENVIFLKKAADQLESRYFKDVIFLKQSKVINFNLKRSVLITGFFVIVATYKTIKRVVNFD